MSKNITRVDIATNVEPILASMRAELDDHLLSINENTDELNQNFACLEAMNQKIDALAQRIDQLSLLLRGLNKPVKEEKKYKLGQLTKKEKAVFSALYVLLTGGKDVTYRALAEKLCLPETLVSSYITNLMEKGIPVLKKRAGRTILLSLERDFQDQQAKQNIVGVNTLLTHWLH